MNKAEKTELIRNKAFELGFSLFGASRAEFLGKEAALLENWLKDGKHGEMLWLENHHEKRANPTLLVPGAKTVISLGFNYFPEIPQPDTADIKISKYAYGRDYHKVIKKKLKLLFDFIRKEIGAVQGRFFVDSAPVMERVWASKSGLGWIGKNTLLINRKLGSFFFLSELIIDIELDASSPVKDLCKACRLCVDACPTNALDIPYQLDAQRCTSYLTIEKKGAIPDEFSGKLSGWVFGCDICQDVCPWNKNSKPHSENSLHPMPHLFALKNEDWLNLKEDAFDELFAGSPVKRTKFEGLKRNISFVAQKNNDLRHT